MRRYVALKIIIGALLLAAFAYTLTWAIVQRALRTQRSTSALVTDFIPLAGEIGALGVASDGLTFKQLYVDADSLGQFSEVVLPVGHRKHVADFTGDGQVSVADIITLVNYVFRAGPLPDDSMVIRLYVCDSLQNTDSTRWGFFVGLR